MTRSSAETLNVPSSPCRHCAGRARPLLAGLAVLIAAAAAFTWELWRPQPGESFSGPTPAATVIEKSLAERLHDDVTTLSVRFGERSMQRIDGLNASADWIAEQLEAAGLTVSRQRLKVSGDVVENLSVTLAGTEWPDELVVVGAHYDTAAGSPGANANGSGVAATLALAKTLSTADHARSVAFVFFACSVEPFMQTETMGSLIWARAAEAAGQEVVGMLSLDSLGYYTDEPATQHFPREIASFYPKVGNFVSVVGNFPSAGLANRVIGLFRDVASVPSEMGVGMPSWDGVGWSDHWSFWQCGWPAVIVSDTGPYRDPAYQRWNDKAQRLDYETMARIVVALESVVAHLANDE